MQQWEGARNNPGKSREKIPEVLLDGCNDFENSLLGLNGTLPDKAYSFVLDQMVANGFAVNQQIDEVVLVGMLASFHFVGVVDPYSMYLFGLSDVSWTDDWCNCSFEVSPYGITWNSVDEDDYWDNPEEFRREISSDEVETYTYTPQQAEGAFRWMLESPGLGNLPHKIGEHIRDLLHGGLGNEDRYAQITASAFEALKETCSYQDKYGATKYDTIRMDLYFECAAWAAFVWLMSPLSAEHRRDNLYLTSAVLDHGEAILVSPGWVYGPNRYIKRELPPEVCHVRGCGLSAYCVTMTLVGDSFDYICEHCKSYGEEIYAPANCGSRVCKAVSCQHHPYNGMGKQLGTHEMLRKTGLLLKQGDPLVGLLGKPSHDPLLLS